MPDAETATNEFSDEALANIWQDFSEQKKDRPAVHQLLCQAYTREGHKIILTLSNPIEESLLSTHKRDLESFPAHAAG